MPDTELKVLFLKKGLVITLTSRSECFFSYFLILVTSHGMQGLSSLIRDCTFTPLQWKHGVLATGPPGKSLECFARAGTVLLYQSHSQQGYFEKHSCVSPDGQLEGKRFMSGSAVWNVGQETFQTDFCKKSFFLFLLEDRSVSGKASLGINFFRKSWSTFSENK